MNLVTITREPRRRQDPALVRYIALIANQLKEAQRPRAAKDIAADLGLSPPQFTQASRAQTSSLEVANALARHLGISLDDFRSRASAWYEARGIDDVVEIVRSRISADDLPEVVRRLQEAYEAERETDDSQTHQAS